MKQKKFTPTTIILIGLLVGAVIAISIVVNPPPALPPPVQSPADIAKGAEDQKHAGEVDQAKMQQKMKDEREKMKSMQTSVARSTKNVSNPDAIEVTNKFFLTTKPGAAGQAEVEARTSKDRAAYKEFMEEQRKKMAAAELEAKPK